MWTIFVSYYLYLILNSKVQIIFNGTIYDKWLRCENPNNLDWDPNPLNTTCRYIKEGPSPVREWSTNETKPHSPGCDANHAIKHWEYAVKSNSHVSPASPFLKSAVVYSLSIFALLVVFFSSEELRRQLGQGLGGQWVDSVGDGGGGLRLRALARCHGAS